jgi:hypothetical protein
LVLSLVAISGAGSAAATPVRQLPGLESITFWERSGGTDPTPFTFAVDSAVLTTRLEDPLTTSNRDIVGVPTEFYDVFYSDGEGAFDVDGE